jgi:hypothetical protein
VLAGINTKAQRNLRIDIGLPHQELAHRSHSAARLAV